MPRAAKPLNPSARNTASGGSWSILRSLPHKPDALTSTTTSPGPGVGSGKSMISSCRLPRNATPRIRSPGFRCRKAAFGNDAASSSGRHHGRDDRRGTVRAVAPDVLDASRHTCVARAEQRLTGFGDGTKFAGDDGHHVDGVGPPPTSRSPSRCPRPRRMPPGSPSGSPRWPGIVRSSANAFHPPDFDPTGSYAALSAASCSPAFHSRATPRNSARFAARRTSGR